MSVELLDDQDDPLPTDALVALVELVLAAEGVPHAEVALHFVDEATIAHLNAEHLGGEGPTDVVSFPVEDALPGVPPTSRPGEPLVLGDVFVAPAVVRRQATDRGVAVDDELALMVVHGVLHLLGWDHVAEAEAEAMEARERELLEAVGRRRP